MAEEFECDETLPDESIELENKLLLLELLDKAGGGPQASGYKSRTLLKLCDEYPMELGYPKSKRRRRVKYLVDRWKRSGNNFAKTRANLLLAASKETSCPDGSCKKKATSSKKEPSIKSPPTIKREKKRSTRATTATTRKMPSTTSTNNLSSPLRLFKGATAVKKGKCDGATIICLLSGSI